MSVPDSETAPLFIALAPALASIEAGVIEEAEVESRHIDGSDTETILTVTVRKVTRPLMVPGEG